MSNVKTVFLFFAFLAAFYSVVPYASAEPDYPPELVRKIRDLNTPDKLPYTVQNTHTIYPSRVVKKGNEVYTFGEKIEDLKLEFNLNGQTLSLDQYIKDRAIVGLMVVKDGVIRYEKYFHNASSETLFTSYSVAKSFVATALFMALKEGKIASLDDLVEVYAPQYKGTDFGQTSIVHLLRMTSGIDFSEDYQTSYSDIRRLFFESLLLGKYPDEFLKPFKRPGSAGSYFHYISANTQVLGAVLSGIYNKPLVDIISEKIWKPMGMEADGYWNQNVSDENGVAISFCCLNARLRDYARFGQFYLDAHKRKGLGREVLPDGWPEALARSTIPNHQMGFGEKSRGYSYHFWVPSNSNGEYMAVGHYGQLIWIDPKNNLVIVRNSADAYSTRHRHEIESVMRTIADAYR